MQDGRITPSMLTASSMYNHYYSPWNARLHARNYGSRRGGWIAKYRNRNQWLQIDFGTKSRVKRICTQGRYDANQFVKSYTVSFSLKGYKFVPYKEGRRTRVCTLRSYKKLWKCTAVIPYPSRVSSSCQKKKEKHEWIVYEKTSSLIRAFTYNKSWLRFLGKTIQTLRLK